MRIEVRSPALFFFAAIIAALFPSLAWSGDAFLHVFYKEAPVSGVEVSLNDELIGKTDERGRLETFVGTGDNTLQLMHNGALITNVEFSVEDFSDEIEINVEYDDDGQGADVSVKNFPEGQSSDAKGFLTGTVTDADDQPIAGATVSALGQDFSAQTDADGTYLLELPRGLYRIEFDHPDFEANDVSDVRIVADIGVQAAVTLYAKVASSGSGVPGAPSLPTLENPSLEEVVILGTFNPTQNAADLERFATSVMDALDIGQLERFGDSDVAAALGRIVGVSVTDDKYANVRGLDGRYISSTLNGLLMPSTDPLRRDVQLDLFPSNILEGIEIQKTYRADLLGSTTGGSVKIKTRGLPDERIIKFSTSGGYTQDVTGDDVASYRGSDDDGWGVDSGLRDLSSGLRQAVFDGLNSEFFICEPDIDPRCTAPIEAAALALAMEDDYNLRSKKANPDFSANASYGDRFELENMDVGFYSALNYKHTTGDRGVATLTNPLSTTGTYVRSKEVTRIDAYLVGGIEFREADEILSKTMLLRSTDDITRRNDVVDEEGIDIEETILEFVERQFFSQQFSGSHEIYLADDASTIEWYAGWSETKRTVPDRRSYQYRNGVFAPSELERRWSELNEESMDIGVDYTLPFTLSDNIYMDLKVGALWSDRSRDFELFRLGIRSRDTMGVDTAADLEQILSYQNFVLDRYRISPQRTADTDFYSSEEEVKALYVNTTFDFGEQWTVDIGARFEEFSQEIQYPFAPDTNPEPLDSDDVLPGINITYIPTEEWQFRLGFSQTVSYPGLIERAEALVFDPETDFELNGNPNLEIATIDNLDFRAEYYFSDEESISLAIFQKDIDSPVERAIGDGSGSSAQRRIEFRNAEKAELFGVEIDAYKNILDFDNSLLFISGNVSWIDSEVTLDEISLRLEGESKQGRQLQGQSEWLANLQIGYDHYETEQKVTLLVNYFDDRIFRVARGNNVDPELFKGRVLVDLNYEKLFGENFTFSASIKNIFNEKVEYEQNDRIIESYDEGASLSLKLEYEFL